jgi:hypothetical protein
MVWATVSAIFSQTHHPDTIQLKSLTMQQVSPMPGWCTLVVPPLPEEIRIVRSNPTRVYVAIEEEDQRSTSVGSTLSYFKLSFSWP